MTMELLVVVAVVAAIWLIVVLKNRSVRCDGGFCLPKKSNRLKRQNRSRMPSTNAPISDSIDVLSEFR